MLNMFVLHIHFQEHYFDIGNDARVVSNASMFFQSVTFVDVKQETHRL